MASPKSKKPILMVSSAVYGFEDLLDRLYASLTTMGYEVWMSHKGTMPVYPEMTALENCRKNVEDCKLFLAVILPRYGSGKEKKGDDSIVHEELRVAIAEKKPRWILAHDHVVFARNFLNKLGHDSEKKRSNLKLKPSAVFEDLRIIDMYELAIRHDVEVYKDRDGNWVQKFSNKDEANLFAVSQFLRYQDAEEIIDDKFRDITAVKKAVSSKKGKKP